MTGRFVAMGVSGAGKSLIGRLFAERIGARFIDGDDLHPPANIAKMSRGEPLTDADREPWLDEVGRRLRESGTVIACSALKRAYRDRIGAAAGAPVTYLYLHGSRDTLEARMRTRTGHFMPAALLESQLATLEEPGLGESVVVADIDAEPDAVVDRLIEGLSEARP